MRHLLCAILLSCSLLAQDNGSGSVSGFTTRGSFYVNGIVYQYASGTDYTVVIAGRPVLNRKYLALKLRVINGGQRSVTVKPEDVTMRDLSAERDLVMVSGTELGRRMRRPYNWARMSVNPVAGAPEEEPAPAAMTPELLAMMRAMAMRANGPGNATILPNRNLLYTDTPGALSMGRIPVPNVECGQVCQLLGRETNGPDVLAQLQRQNTPDQVEQSVFLANTIPPQGNTSGVLFYPMIKLSHEAGDSYRGKKGGRVKVAVPVGEERFEFELAVE